MWRFLILYTFIASIGLWGLQLDSLQPAIEQFCLGLAVVTGWVIYLFDDSVLRTAAVLRDQETLFAIRVDTSCSALSISWLYFAGVLVYPLFTLRQKLLSIAAGLLLIQSVNVIRLMSLVYLGIGFSGETFELIHTQFWPFVLHLLTLLCMVFFLFYHRPPANDSA